MSLLSQSTEQDNAQEELTSVCHTAPPTPRQFFFGRGGHETPALGSTSTHDDQSRVDSLPSSSSGGSLSSKLERQSAFRLVAEALFWRVKRQRLFAENGLVPNGVAIRAGKGDYVHFPRDDPRLEPWVVALQTLNCEAAFTLTSSVAAGITASLPPGTFEVQLTHEDRIQVVESMQALSKARRAQGACFVRTQGCLIVWADDVKHLIDAGNSLEEKMINYIWAHTKQNNAASSMSMSSLPTSKSTSSTNSNTSSASSLKGVSSKDVASDEADSQLSSVGGRVRRFFSKSAKSGSNDARDDEGEKGEKDEAVSAEDLVHRLESGEPCLEKGRSINMFAPLYTGLGLGLNVALMCLFTRRLLIESLLDGQWMRMALCATIPVFMLIIQFMCDNVIGVIAQIFLPISQLNRNSLYYSAKRSARLPAGYTLPHFTIAMPVYKEGLESVLAPTIESVQKAIATYELQGGTANILVSEDGMQLLTPEQQEVRRDYYERHNVAWVARPGHGKDGYIRKGRFKKASNLNFSWDLSLRVEEIMDELRPEAMAAQERTSATWYEDDEKALYDEAFERAITESSGRAWASGDIRIGSYILLIDSDTRVPADCFMDAACELERSPEIGALQHCSGVMYVADHYFERMIGFFTKIVNLSISWCVSNGTIAPLVGHNAFLRWQAVQEVIYTDVDGERCIWSHQHVSEDFDMALRLLMKGFLVRWATYSNEGFMEGVSLTADDEVNRWQKYAFGCSELVFNNLRHWPTRGPLSPLFRKFIWSNCPTSYKLNACSYIFSYWAIAAGTILTISLFFVQGFFWPWLDQVFMPPFQVCITALFIFALGGTVGQVAFRARSGKASLLGAAVEQIKWLPALLLFFSGLSYHVMLALAAHPFGYNMTWSATVKDVEESNFWKEIPSIIRRFWHCYLVMFLFAAAMIIFSTPLIPLEWRIEGFTIFWPGSALIAAHILYPLALNPWLMRFEF
ncbi:hypothetical protein PHSY_003580 [Pseudozyma hubeiensis SY62]|uniref:Uncharacterized protein n=1 Tax=Pseudozyma hubeiensis (strain SY62) TaxID=1305764 RepID=R9P3R2_PSEHS|nr:hypothetical protein PHSY_003580 [Pseudozyma hubeiensis SY62]GAC96001.1 hypothetical protein PHSY_003580 [Pseudozyma hubeiensis SY62]